MTWEDYEHAAARFMQRIGFPDAEVTRRGADGGIDIYSLDAVAQVKARNTATSRPEIQQLHGAALAVNKRSLFFSLSGYTAGAIEWAESAGVALFVLESTGNARPVGTHGIELAETVTSQNESVLKGETFGAFLTEVENGSSTQQNLLVHLVSSDRGTAQGRAVAKLVAGVAKKPLRVLDSSSVTKGGSVTGIIRAMQHLSPGEIIYLDQIEHFPDRALRVLLLAFCDRINLIQCDEALDSFVRNQDVASKLRQMVRSYREMGEAATPPKMSTAENGDRRGVIPHVLLSGPTGLGKLILARILADELGSQLVALSGPALRRPADLIMHLCNLDFEDHGSPTVLFFDEIDRLPEGVEEKLCEALEHNWWSVDVGDAETSRVHNIDLPPFICVGAVTEAESLSPRLLDCFGLQHEISTYSLPELAKLVQRIWDRVDFKYEDEALIYVAEEAKGMPQCALEMAHLILRIDKGEVLSVERATEILKEFKDYDGFSEVDWLLMGLQNRVGPEVENVSLGWNFGVLPYTTVVAATTIPWSIHRDARKALSGMGASFKTLVMPQLLSTGQSMMRWELEDVYLHE